MSDGGRGRDPWRPLVGEPTESDFEDAYDGDAELDATIRARRRRRRIAVITAGGALTFAIGGSLVLPEGDADAPADSTAATLAAADRQSGSDGSETLEGAERGSDPLDDAAAGESADGAPLPISTTIDLPPTLTGTGEPFEIVAVTGTEVHRIAVPSGDVTTRSLTDDERVRTGSSSVMASPTMAAVRVADDSVVLVPNSDAPLIDWPADTFGLPAPGRSVFVEGRVPGDGDRFVVGTITRFDADPGEDGVIDESEFMPPEIERYVVDPGLAAPIDRILTDLPPDAAIIGDTGWWWSEDLSDGTFTLGGSPSGPEVIDGWVVGAGTQSIAFQACLPDGCSLTTYVFEGGGLSEVRTLSESAVPEVFVEPVSVFRGGVGLVSDDASLLLDSRGAIDLVDGGPPGAGALVGPVAWVPGTTDVVTIDRDQEGLAVADPRSGETVTFGGELGRPLAIATTPLG